MNNIEDIQRELQYTANDGKNWHELHEGINLYINEVSPNDFLPSDIGLSFA